MPQRADTPIARILRDRIRADGPITFADWMQTALYHPEHGYYRRERPAVGIDGDFLTSPEVHPIFGAAVAAAASDAWRNLDRPDPFNVVEVGPGTGALAESMLRNLDREAAQTISLTLIEPNRFATARQQQRLREFPRIAWAGDLAEIPSRSARLIIANELLDALPVHRLVHCGEWRELRVGWDDARGFHDAPAPIDDSPGDQDLLAPLAGISPEPGWIAEVSPARAEMIADLAARLDRGFLLLFDYGYPRADLYSRRHRQGTLATARRHVPGDDPCAHPGDQDLTTHIDLDQVREAALAAGLSPLPVLAQSDWLRALAPRILPPGDLAARRALETLVDPDGLGRISVLGFTAP